ncbi:MAG: class I SAM-dependent rRNA methyltransferase [Smithellaceae bacterium]
MYPEITLKGGREAALLRGHPWVFSGAIAGIQGQPSDGDVVLAKDSKGKPLALGFFNNRTDISFRVLTRETNTLVDADFWRERVRVACQLRGRLINGKTSAYRLINAEGDGCPGLIADVYSDTLVCSITIAGMEKQRQNILDALIFHLKPARIYEQSAGRSRGLEGLKEQKGFIYGDDQKSSVRVTENGHAFDVDFIGGQKTGFFLDQRGNREKLGALSRNMTVLNCFCYTGAFSVYAAAGGAKKVVSLDISKSACTAAAEHLCLNGFKTYDHPVIEADVFQYLRDLQDRFDLIILDPPAFAKTKRDVPKASRGYKEINMQAMKHLAPGGMLATFSCSNFMEEDLFYKIVQGSARDARADVQLLSRLEAGPDHPMALGHPEGRYLKGLLVRKS